MQRDTLHADECKTSPEGLKLVVCRNLFATYETRIVPVVNNLSASSYFYECGNAINVIRTVDDMLPKNLILTVGWGKFFLCVMDFEMTYIEIYLSIMSSPICR